MDNPASIALIYSILKIVVALLLVVLNGLFVAAEFAFVKVRPTRIAQLAAEGNSKAVLVNDCLDNIDAYLSVSQLGITLASLGLGWLGEPAVASLINPLLLSWGVQSLDILHTISFVIAFSVITLLHVVFGELAPKSIAIQKAESMALWLAGPMRLFYFIFYPAVVLLNGTANRVVKLLGLQPASESELIHSEEELRMLISESYRGGEINQGEQELLQNVFRFEDRVAEEIMVPRTEVVFLDSRKSLTDNLKLVRQTGHTRFPLCDGSPDRVSGLINIKDLLNLDENIKEIADIKREMLFIPEAMSLGELLHTFQNNHQHMAVVLDEYGGTAGIVTMENVLEELVGEIQDEFDNEEPEIISGEDGSLLVSGQMFIDTAAEKFKLDIDEEDEQYNTLAGYMLGKIGKRPREGDAVVQENIKLEVVKMKGMRIDRIRISKIKPETK
ncbi:MAG: hemolysin family protein [Syntrophomonas sp.]